jgi:hypothetical protein
VPGAAPAWVTALFVVLVLAMAGLVVVAAGAWRGRAAGLATAAGLGAWLALTALLAGAGVFHDFSRVPPRFVVAFLPPLAVIVVLCRSVAVGRFLDALPSGWLVYPQAFRIVMEIILWRLFVAGTAPAIMTFEGRNADILVGLTAPVVAWLCLDGRRRIARWWNVAGILILVNVVAHALLSAPTPFRVFLVDPPPIFLTFAPWIWLPTFLVPLAWGLHALSLRQLSRRG